MPIIRRNAIAGIGLGLRRRLVARHDIVLEGDAACASHRTTAYDPAESTASLISLGRTKFGDCNPSLSKPAPQHEREDGENDPGASPVSSPRIHGRLPAKESMS